MMLLWHAFHDELMSFYRGTVEERIAQILATKPEREHKLRLQLLRPVRGRLDSELVEAGLASSQAWKAWKQASEAHEQAVEAYFQIRAAYNRSWEAYNQARGAYDQAGEACCQAWEAYNQARGAYLQILAWHNDKIEDLHKVECPDCPWDGETIFSGKESERNG